MTDLEEIPMDVKVTTTTGFTYINSYSGLTNRMEFHATDERLTMILRYPEGMPDTLSIPVASLDACIEALNRMKRLRDL